MGLRVSELVKNGQFNPQNDQTKAVPSSRERSSGGNGIKKLLGKNREFIPFNDTAKTSSGRVVSSDYAKIRLITTNEFIKKPEPAIDRVFEQVTVIRETVTPKLAESGETITTSSTQQATELTENKLLSEKPVRNHNLLLTVYGYPKK
ncbi:hypothetical protein [Endozoicomonas elysicola]|uniref:Uncharacterized protein n=1 Tax=Endozoicomonas elysicola TaxID=305900 RepID=A0A081KCH5_9GAMM|nr:hypothetical protein [Endozoicomonas elysicola]KEI71851.1 hypothetical protein GV64_14890 [Endozoicomonas elysicola]